MPFQMPFLYKPPIEEAENGEDTLYGRLDFTQEETARFHSACKDHGRTVTQVFSALLNLAHVETALRSAGNAGLEQYQDVLSTLEMSTHIFSSMNSVNVVCVRIV